MTQALFLLTRCPMIKVRSIVCDPHIALKTKQGELGNTIALFILHKISADKSHKTEQGKRSKIADY
jgi:hypothetical protein